MLKNSCFRPAGFLSIVMEQQNTKEVGVNRSGQAATSSLRRQRGFVFKLIHSLLIVAGVVMLVVLYKTGKLSEFVQKARTVISNGVQPSAGKGGNYTQVSRQEEYAPVTRPNEDNQYTESGRYAVQVAAGYDSRQLYMWRDDLARAGYDAYLISLNTSRGMMFKLRVGAYTDRMDAEAMRDRLSRRFPTNFGDSFVVHGD